MNTVNGCEDAEVKEDRTEAGVVYRGQLTKTHYIYTAENSLVELETGEVKFWENGPPSGYLRLDKDECLRLVVNQ